MPTGRAAIYRGTPLVVIAVDVQDPGNVGAIVRVAEAGGASGVVCAGACADPFGWKALRGSMGSALRLPILVHRDSREAIDEARRHGCRIVATVAARRPAAVRGRSARADRRADRRRRARASPRRSSTTADERVTIPMEPPVESLNAAVTRRADRVRGAAAAGAA